MKTVMNKNIFFKTVFFNFPLLIVFLFSGGVFSKSEEKMSHCEKQYNIGLKNCLDQGLAGQGSGQMDFGYIPRCTKLHKDKYKNCVGGAENNIVSGACNKEEAKINIDWVLDKDVGARARYEKFRSDGQSAIQAIISAQAHNANAQNSIKRCRNWAVRYISGSINTSKDTRKWSIVFWDPFSGNFGHCVSGDKATARKCASSECVSRSASNTCREVASCRPRPGTFGAIASGSRTALGISCQAKTQDLAGRAATSRCAQKGFNCVPVYFWANN